MLYAMFAMILLISAVAGRLLTLRIRAVKLGNIKLSKFRLNDSNDIPSEITQAARNYSNLFEVPVLFYAAAGLAIALHLQTPSMIVLSWLFVISRVIHSWIHLTYNNVVHRLQAFIVGIVCVILIWLLLLWEYHKVSLN